MGSKLTCCDLRNQWLTTNGFVLERIWSGRNGKGELICMYILMQSREQKKKTFKQAMQTGNPTWSWACPYLVPLIQNATSQASTWDRQWIAIREEATRRRGRSHVLLFSLHTKLDLDGKKRGSSLLCCNLLWLLDKLWSPGLGILFRTVERVSKAACLPLLSFPVFLVAANSYQIHLEQDEAGIIKVEVLLTDKYFSRQKGQHLLANPGQLVRERSQQIQESRQDQGACDTIATLGLQGSCHFHPPRASSEPTGDISQETLLEPVTNQYKSFVIPGN